MAILTRITRLFTADMHAVLDRLEEPEALLRQSIREMETALASQLQSLRSLQAESKQIQSRSAKLDESLRSIAEELDLSFAAGNDALIRKCLRRRLESERLLKHLAQTQSKLAAQIDELAPLLDTQRERLDAMRQKAALFDVETANGATEGNSWNAEDAPVSDADIDLAMLRELQVRRAS